MKFSDILHVFEPSGEDFFDKEVLRDLRKSSEPSSCHEDVSKDREAVKEALSKGFYEGQGNEGNEGSREVCRGGRSTQPGSRRCLRPCEACGKLTQHAGQ